MTRRSSLRESSVGKKIGIFFIVVIVVFGVIFGGKIIKYIPVLYDLAFKKEIALRQSDQRINILLLGIGGGKHDGPNLTDTLILASVDPQTNKVTLISVPRDLWIV